MIGKVLNNENKGFYDDFIQCMMQTTDRGANIINLSLGVSFLKPKKDDWDL
jgi:hypothetical protein